MQVFPGALDTGMAEAALDDADIDPGFQEVIRAGMPLRMHREAGPDYAGSFFSADKSGKV
jgi:hypothetical protein